MWPQHHEVNGGYNFSPLAMLLLIYPSTRVCCDKAKSKPFIFSLASTLTPMTSPFSRATSQTVAFQPACDLSCLGAELLPLLTELHEDSVDSVLKLIQVCLSKSVDQSPDSSCQPFPLTLCHVKSFFCVTIEVTNDDAEHYGPQH